MTLPTLAITPTSQPPGIPLPITPDGEALDPKAQTVDQPGPYMQDCPMQQMVAVTTDSKHLGLAFTLDPNRTVADLSVPTFQGNIDTLTTVEAWLSEHSFPCLRLRYFVDGRPVRPTMSGFNEFGVLSRDLAAATRLQVPVGPREYVRELQEPQAADTASLP
ncbi:MAG: hypothetical protein ACI9OJ_004361 [Myxococcota bacterium]|jgi:hypothetical protein